MSHVRFILPIVAFLEAFYIDGQSTLGSCETNGLNMVDEILQEIRYTQNRVQTCSYNLSKIEDLLVRNYNIYKVEDLLVRHLNLSKIEDLLVRNDNIFKVEDLLVRHFNLSKIEDLLVRQLNLSKIEDLLVRQFNNITQTLQSFNNARQDVCTVVTWPRDCEDIAKVGQNASDVYQVSVLGPGSVPVEISVYCDMNSSNASWLVFQRRMDGSEKFERTWIEYKNGFGNLRGEFWLGNTALHLLTSNRDYKLRIELEDFDGDKRYAEYTEFYVGSASDNYRLNISGYSGDAGDAMATHNGQMFTTLDADHDREPKNNCAKLFRGAWWYNSCHAANLNGRYLRGNHSTYADGVEWKKFRGHYYSLKHVEMKIAPRD